MVVVVVVVFSKRNLVRRGCGEVGNRWQRGQRARESKREHERAMKEQ